MFCSTHFPELNFLAVKKTSSASIYLLPSQVLSPEFVAIPQLLCCPITKFFVLNLLPSTQVLRHDFLETHFLYLSPVVTLCLRQRRSSRLQLFCLCICVFVFLFVFAFDFLYFFCFCTCVCVFVLTVCVLDKNFLYFFFVLVFLYLCLSFCIFVFVFSTCIFFH